MVFLSCTSRDSSLVCICGLKIECGARPLTRRGEEDGFHFEIESSGPSDEETELYPVDPLSSRGINKFLRESELIPSYNNCHQSAIECHNYQSETKSYQSESKVSKENHTEHDFTINDITMNTDIDKLKKLEGIHCERSSSKPVVVSTSTSHQYCYRRSRTRSTRHSRDREPSRISYNKILNLINRKGKVMKKLMLCYLNHKIPHSSLLKRMLIPTYRVHVAIRTSMFKTRLQNRRTRPVFSSLWHDKGSKSCYFYVFKARTAKHKSSPTILFFYGPSSMSQNTSKQSETYCATQTELLLSNDVEQNPGPASPYAHRGMMVIDTPMVLLQARLAQQGLRAVEVGADGSCFFRSVSFQLYNDVSFHMNVRAAAVNYMRTNPDRFIEHVTDQSWVSYLNNMSQQSTWCDHLAVQAVSDALNVIIRITESHAQFAPMTIISPVGGVGDPTIINIAHLDEVHYMSTVPIGNDETCANSQESNKVHSSEQSAEATSQQLSQVSTINKLHGNTVISKKGFDKRAYMREYMKRRRESESFRKKEIVAKQKKRSENIESAKAYERHGYHKRKAANPDLTAKLRNEAYQKQKKNNPELLREFTRKRKQNNPEHVRNINKKAQKKRRASVISAPSDSDMNNDCTANVFNMPEVIQCFHDNIEVGPEYICTCCDQLWYKSSVSKCDSSKYSACSKSLVEKCVTGTKSVNNTEWICATCDSNLREGKLPVCSKANKMSFPVKPECLNLTPLEERLISPRIPFMQIRELPRGGQLTIHGNVVNVPADVSSTVNMLPRPINESQTIPIKLKRRLNYKHHYQFQNVRPTKVLEAAEHLVKTSKLFQKEHIEVQENWQNNVISESSTSEEANAESEWGEFLEAADNITGEHAEIVNDSVPPNESEQILQQDTPLVTTANENTSNDDGDDDGWCEVEERPSGVTDTLLQPPNITENVEKILSFAPGEGNRPLGIFMDKDSEFLAFPTIYCGETRPDNKEREVPVHYSTVCKWELRSQDRRVAQSVPNIFYKLKKLQIKQVQDSASLSLRKCKTKGKKYTAGELKSDDYVNKLIHLDEGFRVLRNLRGSPPYFEKCKKDLFAMIRQLGNPTWFCSFSAAETRWSHLLKTLSRIVDNKVLSDGDVKNMTWQQKSDLIQKDPVTCARNFDHMVQLFFRDVLKSDAMPIGEIVDFFYRVEFQQRGSPHIHCLLWIKDAPQFGKSSKEQIVEFVDKYISCVNDQSSDDMGELVNLQMHRHAKTCKKQGHQVCRFNFPLPPMPSTMILEPLVETNLEEDELNRVKENCKEIKSVLNDMKYGEDITFESFLDKLKLTHDQYMQAIRYSLTRPTLLLKRSPSEIRINNYNHNLLKAWRANMDIQFVLDPYACAVYILSYITKGQRGMSKLLEKASKEANNGNKDITNKVRNIGNKFLNAVEISAQEAVYLVLQMPLRRSSRDFQFINTSNPDERVFLLKTQNKINEMPDNSTDIESDNIIKRYQRRPRQLENTCLAHFVAWYTCVKDTDPSGLSSTKKEMAQQSELPETDFADSKDDDQLDQESDVSEGSTDLLMKGGLRLVKRRKTRIIRSVRFNKEKDPENYFREQLMLYVPWRNEQKDLIGDCQTYQDRYTRVESVVTANKLQYEYHADILDQAMEDMSEESSDRQPVAPNTQHINDQDVAAKTKPSELFGCFDPGANKQHSQYDMYDDMGILPRCNDDEDLLQNRLQDSDYRKLVRSLNVKQKEFFYHVLHSIKVADDPLKLFLSGGAGVGKSTVTNALYEAIIRYLTKTPGENPDEVKVLKVAPTGKAAFNIKGNTLHSAFKVPANKGFQYCSLDADRLNTMRSQLRKLKVIFIDEISMVGSGMFNFLNLRLQQIMGTQEAFGGVSVITVGDLFQLKPVFDKWIFENGSNTYDALATNIWEQCFKMFELTEIMRQKDDVAFAELLNRLREGNHTQADIETLKRRVLIVEPGEPNYPTHATHLFTTNHLVNMHNTSVFQNAQTKKAQIKCIDLVVGDISDELKTQIKEKIPNDPSKTMGLNNLVSIAVGSKYDLTTNVNVCDGMTNGTECVIKDIEYRVHNSTRPSIIWVSFPDKFIGVKQRREYGHLYNNNTDRTWTPILEITRQFKISNRHQAQVLRRQFPLRAAAAKTIHRCQGDTLNEAVVDLPSCSRDHMHYVGLSRLRNSSHLHILNLNESKVCVSKKVKGEMTRLRENMLIPCLQSLYDIKQNAIKILFQNVRSLHLHFDDVKCDYNVCAADLNAFVETELCSRDIDTDYQLDGFSLFRNDISPTANVRKPCGTAVYINDRLQYFSEPFRANYNNVEFTVSVLSTLIPDLHIVSVYRSKSEVNMRNFLDAINHLLDDVIPNHDTPVVILGDFNVNLLEVSSDSKALTKCLVEDRGFTQLITTFTTDYNSLLDHIYTNIPNKVHSSGVLESYYSDHKPIYVSLCN